MSLERIEITPFAVIVGDILQERRTGYLTIIQTPTRKVLYWSQGELVLVVSAAPDGALYVTWSNFNNATAEYNTSIQEFPAVLIAPMLHFQPEVFLEFGQEERAVMSQAPKVSFAQ